MGRGEGGGGFWTIYTNMNNFFSLREVLYNLQYRSLEIPEKTLGSIRSKPTSAQGEAVKLPE